LPVSLFSLLLFESFDCLIIIRIIGDFRQCPPVVPKGSRSQIVDACINNASFWSEVVTLPLIINMRLLRNRASMTPEEREEAEQFANWLLRVGEGLTDGDETGLLRLPQDCCIPPDSESCVDQLIDAIYPGINTLNSAEDIRREYFKERAILAPRNASIDDLNEKIIGRLPGEEKVFLSADKASDDSGQSVDNLPLEYLNRITFGGFPLHKTVLKVGTPVLLLRNLDPASGLCNGTRLLITRLAGRVIEGKILTGSHAGNIVFIPRIPLTSESNLGLPFTLRRVQFPIRLAFGMTINKSQGQSLNHVGLCLITPVFTHGQLYVGLSRGTSGRNIRMLLDNSPAGRANQTANITYNEIFKRGRGAIQDEAMDVD
jgi:ATP-dependent DNA helicase PIF1